MATAAEDRLNIWRRNPRRLAGVTEMQMLKPEQSDRASNPNEEAGKLLLLDTAEGVRPVPTLLYAMPGRQALIRKAASRCRRLWQPTIAEIIIIYECTS